MTSGTHPAWSDMNARWKSMTPFFGRGRRPVTAMSRQAVACACLVRRATDTENTILTVRPRRSRDGHGRRSAAWARATTEALGAGAPKNTRRSHMTRPDGKRPAFAGLLLIFGKPISLSSTPPRRCSDDSSCCLRGEASSYLRFVFLAVPWLPSRCRAASGKTLIGEPSRRPGSVARAWTGPDRRGDGGRYPPRGSPPGCGYPASGPEAGPAGRTLFALARRLSRSGARRCVVWAFGRGSGRQGQPFNCTPLPSTQRRAGRSGEGSRSVGDWNRPHAATRPVTASIGDRGRGDLVTSSATLCWGWGGRRGNLSVDPRKTFMPPRLTGVRADPPAPRLT